MANPVVHWEIGGIDGEKLKEFYDQLFDWEIQHIPEMKYYVCEVGEGGIGGGLFQVDESQGMKPFITVYVQVDDLQAALNKAESLGGKAVCQPTKISDEHGYYAMFTDPDGNLVGLWCKTN